MMGAAMPKLSVRSQVAGTIPAIRQDVVGTAFICHQSAEAQRPVVRARAVAVARAADVTVGEAG